MTSNGEKISSAEVGLTGEKIARDWLRANGCKVLYQNFRAPKGGEVDIVVRDHKTLAFVEVKTRTSENYGRGLDAVNAKKQSLIRRGAEAWLRELGTREIPWRFDVIEVNLKDGHPPKVHRVENAFS